MIQCDVKSNNTKRNSIYRSVDDIARREHYKPSEMLQRFVNYSGLPERRFRFILWNSPDKGHTGNSKVCDASDRASLSFHANSTCKRSRIIFLHTGQLPCLTSSCTMQLHRSDQSNEQPRSSPQDADSGRTLCRRYDRTQSQWAQQAPYRTPGSAKSPPSSSSERPQSAPETRLSAWASQLPLAPSPPCPMTVPRRLCGRCSGWLTQHLTQITYL